jgi:hypothetical protein
MELNAKKYIDFLDQTLDLDNESKSKTTWIVIRILNTLMTIELAIFIAEKFGYGITAQQINFDIILLIFKNYDILVGVTCFILAYFGARVFSLLLPNIFTYTQYWSTWSIDNEFKDKLNKILEDPDEFERWRLKHEKRLHDANINTKRFTLLLLFIGNLYLTYHFIILHKHTLFYNKVISLLLSFAFILISLLYTLFKGDLMWSLDKVNYFENKQKFKIEPVRKIDRFGLKTIHWIVTAVSVVVIIAILTLSPYIKYQL